MGPRGALLTYGSGAPIAVPASSLHTLDTCGAGDRFAATAALALGSGQVTVDAVEAAVRSASAHVADGGAAGLGDLPEPTRSIDGSATGAAAEVVSATRDRGGVVVATGGCFDLLHAGHIASLRAARSLGDCLVVCLNSDRSVRRLKGPGRPLVSQEDRTRVLEALDCVDAVAVFDQDTPAALLEQLRPDVWAKGGDYAGSQLPEGELLSCWGGQAVVLPYLEGRSTSLLVRTATQSSGPRS
jgi:rfaE bifunctional protein nucleotidyltransferase chain/domain